MGQVMSWHQCQQIVGRGCWLCMVHVKETLPLLVPSWQWGGCDCPCAGLCLLPLVHSKSPVLSQGRSLDPPEAGAGVVWACRGFVGAQQCWMWEWLRGQGVLHNQGDAAP